MKLIYFFTIIFLIFLSIDICPQDVVIVRLKGTYNFFSMSDETAMQKDLLQEILNQNVPAVASESFPPDYGVQFQFLYILTSKTGKEYHLGFFFDHASTNARIDFKNSSGEFKLDQQFKAFSFGPVGELYKDLGSNFNFTVGLSLPLIFGSFGVKAESRTGNNVSTQQFDFSSVTLGFEPGFTLSYLFQHVTLGINMDYLAAFSSSYYLNSDSEVKLLNKSGDPISMGMNGWRFGLALGYRF
jgi:hypothetical protein